MVQVQGNNNTITVGTGSSSEGEEGAELWGDVTTVQAADTGEVRSIPKSWKSGFLKRIKSLLRGQDEASREGVIPNEAFELRHRRAVNGDANGFSGWLQNIQAHLNPKHGAEDT